MNIRICMSIRYESIALDMLSRAVHCVALVCGMFHFRKPLKTGEKRKIAVFRLLFLDCCLWIAVSAF